MKRLKWIAQRNAPLWRTLEISIISSLISWAITLLQAINAYFLQGTSIDYKLIISLFIASLVTGITAWLTKYLRDKQKKLIQEDVIEPLQEIV